MPDIDSISVMDNHNFLACTEDAPAENTSKGEKQNRQNRQLREKYQRRKLKGTTRDSNIR